jgi:cell division protein ZapB
LTYQVFFNYSVAVEAELDILDEKISQLVKLCHRLRTDNQELRQQLAEAQSANKQLREKIASARTRLETLLTRLPEDEE